MLLNADGAQDFPKRLEDGEAAQVRMLYDAIAECLRREGCSGNVTLRPVCSDTTGKTYTGKPWNSTLTPTGGKNQRPFIINDLDKWRLIPERADEPTCHGRSTLVVVRAHAA